MENIRLNMESYSSDIVFGDFKEIFNITKGCRKIFICDSNTAQYIPESVSDFTLILKPGEKHKTWKSIDKILKFALNNSLGRDDFIIGAGGGVITDMAAFAASLYMRGCGLVLVPTTLLSMVDAAVGGKTGVDFCKIKNLAGTFYPAEKIIIDFKTLSTLKDRDYRSGIAEILKAGFLSGGELFDLLKNKSTQLLERKKDVLERAVYLSIQFKAEIVRQDLKESGIRGFLNLGHTFGHALETASDFKGCTHGEAVAWGIAKAMEAGIKTGITDPKYADMVIEIIRMYNFETRNRNIKTGKVLNAMLNDKKKREGRVRFILQKKLADTAYYNLDKDIIKSVIS